MRHTCLMLLILSVGMSPVAAGDNPFSKARPAAKPSVPMPQPGSMPVPEPGSLDQPVRPAPLIKPVEPISPPASEMVSERLAKLGEFAPTSVADLLLSSPLIPPVTVQSPSDLPERQIPGADENAGANQSDESVGESSDNYDGPRSNYEDSLGDLDDMSSKPSVQNLFSAPSIYGEKRFAEVVGERIAIPPLIIPTISTAEIGNKTLPDDIGGEALVLSKPLPEGFDRLEEWALTSYFWQAPNTFSHPLYFDDPMLERHGHERFPCLTPLVSGARFFVTIPMLPYLTTVKEPCDCVYTLGHFRPGTCAPALFKRPPYERRAAIVQALATAGFFIGRP